MLRVPVALRYYDPRSYYPYYYGPRVFIPRGWRVCRPAEWVPFAAAPHYWLPLSARWQAAIIPSPKQPREVFASEYLVLIRRVEDLP